MDRDALGQLTLIVAGIGLLVAAPFAEPPSGPTVSVDQEPLAAPPENASVVAFEDLSDDRQSTFRRALDDGDARPPGDGEWAIDYDYVHYRGEYYAVYLVASDAMGSGQVFLVAGLGVGAIVVAGLWRFTGARKSSGDGPSPPEP